MFADWLIIFLSIVRFSLILQFRRWELFLENGTHGKSQNQIKCTFSESVILWNQFIFPKPVSIKHLSHTNQRYTGTTLCRVGKLFISMTHFRKKPLINESFTGEIHFLVFCIQRIVLLLLVIFVDHDWNSFVGVLRLDTFTLPVCPGLR